MWYPKDYPLSALQLAIRYDEAFNAEHPGYTRWEWRNEVSHLNTLLGYWEWVQHQLECEENELSADSPF
jgi:hypothetical protein